MSAELRLTAAQARRIALAAQGFETATRDSDPGLRQITRVVRELGLLQLDSVNVFCRAHYMPLFSRLGPYDRGLLDRIAAHSDSQNEARRQGSGAGRSQRRLIEYWAHEASLIPIEHHRLMRWRMDRVDQAWGSVQRIITEQPQLVADTLALVAAHGPVRARDTGVPRKEASPGHMWNWHDGKVALEYLFYSGRVTASSRVNFERRYDLSERVLPQLEHDPPPSREDGQRELMRISARALGVATEPDLGDYFRLPRADSRARVAELVAAGELIEVEVSGWGTAAYLWPGTRRPRSVNARALLSPFDSLVFFRPRTQRIWDFRYRIEIYVPAPKRRYGYYVLPFLLGDSLVARVDLKSDRRAGVLRVQGAFLEEGQDAAGVARELAAELELAASWLGLDQGVEVVSNGDLAPALSRVL